MSTLTQFLAGKLKSQEFLSSGGFTVPAGVTTVLVTMTGGGGSGAVRANTANAVATGGASGYYIIQQPVSVTPGASITVTIGAGGAGVASSVSNGNVGGATSFGSLTVSGGSGGIHSANASDFGSLGGRPSRGVGTYSQQVFYGVGGSSGANVGAITATTTARGTGGAGGLYGDGTNAVAGTPSSAAAANSGAGTGGCVSTVAGALTSGTGGSGRCIVEWIA